MIDQKSIAQNTAYPYSWKKKLFFYVFLATASIFIVFVVLEGGYRLYLTVFSPIIIYTPDGAKFNPNSIGKYKGGRVSIDKYGFRNGIDQATWGKSRKILLIGDSVGFGYGVSDEFTISHLLNEESGTRSLGFLSMCHPGWDTPRIRDLLYQQGEELGPWELIIWIYYINDAKTSTSYKPPLIDKSAVKQMNLTGRMQWFLYRFFKWPFVLKPKIKQIYKKAKRGILKSDPPAASWDSYYEWCLSAYELDSETRINEEKYIGDVVAWCERNKAGLLFLICPAETQFADGNTKPHEFIKELSHRYNFPVVDLKPYLEKANTEERVFLPGDMAHLNPKGNKLVSNIIKVWLVKNKYVIFEGKNQQK